jgi:hypothetical protein
MAFKANEYIRELIAKHGSLFVHDEHTHLNNDGSAVFVISGDKHRFLSVALSTAGLTSKENADLRFAQAMVTLTDGAKALEEK